MTTPASGLMMAEPTIEVERLRRELDEARVDIGRRVAEIRGAQETLDFARQEVTAARSEAKTLRHKLARQGDADLLKLENEERDREIARLQAKIVALEAEIERGNTLRQGAEKSHVRLERRVAELESLLAESHRRVALLETDLTEKSGRLRRLSELTDP